LPETSRKRTPSSPAWTVTSSPLSNSTRDRLQLKRGTDPAKVAMVLPLSGPIVADSVPSGISQTCTIYEIGLVSQSPTTGFLRQREDLESFRLAYRGLLARLRGEHAGLRELHVFPAVAAPVAVACGFDLLPKVDPTLVIYDNLMKDGGFIERLRVNT